MNIKELAEQAGFFPSDNFGHTNWHAAGFSKDFERFAELVAAAEREETSMTDQERKAMEMALEALEDAETNDDGEARWDLHTSAKAALRQALAQPEQEPTVPDNMQDWAKLDGVTAWHLMERHADNWADVGKMMNEFIEAKIKTAQPEKEPDSAINGVLIDRILELEAELAKADVTLTDEGNTEQEPVAWVEVHDTVNGPYEFHGMNLLPKGRHHLFTAPPSKPWVDLSDDEISRVWHKHLWESPSPHKDFARAIEAALRSKNNG